MGGFGSGRWTRSNSAIPAEALRNVDIRYMRQQGLLIDGLSGVIYWNHRDKPFGQVAFTHFGIGLNLSFQPESDQYPKAMNQFILFDKTPCHYGGERIWFKCPCCSRRIAILYLHRFEFACRNCHGLTYTSRQLSHMDRIINRKHEVGYSIFERYIDGRGYGKKKGMHWATFLKKLQKYEAIQQRWCHVIHNDYPQLSPDPSEER